ncbi:component of IIS longevity pathway SMK-1-domain-containing protein [Myxozyma melibiosi]|uniref:Component of IIS longevity pathway SMK-1-domain-containing protein n=1 Tax=Myxozyma melibiosi TaxID=54550 RepID=A0ABR1F712_9ASCO
MSFEVPAIPRRVKVYELLNESWHDRGTGFCVGDIISDDAYILVKGEDDEEKYLLETKIFKDVQYQKQQDTLIVWTDPDETDLALSFQESDGCTAVWEFITDVQRNLGLDDIASDDINDNFGSGSIALPAEPTLTNLSEVEKCLTIASHCQYGRGPVLRDLIEYDYIGKLVPLLAMAEDLESITDLHALCRIMKLIILMNDNTIMEQIVLEEYIVGVVGILEYDPEFPSFKANHRDYISDESRFKEVVPISDEEVRNKIKYTFRLQYLKDVVLARLLDDPTFSMLSSMIFFHQVAILNNLQHNEEFINALFNIFDDDLNNASQISGNSQTPVIEAPFIHQFCLTAKNLQASQRASLYSNFIKKRLFAVIDFALRDSSPSIRSSGTELILALIDHDPSLVRNVVLENDNQKQTAIVDTLIDILLSEPDFGITSQVAEALQILLDPTSGQPYDVFRKTSDFMVRQRADDPEIEMFLDSFYGPPVERLFRKLSDLQPEDIPTISVARASFFSCLCELVSAFIRLHGYRSRTFLIESNVLLNIGKLFSSSHKSLRLVALRCFRQCLGTNDEFYFRFLVKNKLFGPVVELLADLGDKNNLLSSACLEFFEFIRSVRISSLLTVHPSPC